jgi:hypothetical protein
MSKVTKFYGQVNDQEFENVNDYNKAIVQAMNDGNLQNATSRTWVEEVQEIKEVKEEPKKNTLRGIFEGFKNTPHKDLKTAFINLKEEIDEYLIDAKPEDLQDDLALLEAEKQDFASSLVNIRETHKRSCFELQKQQEQLDIQLAKVNSLEETCKKEEEFLHPWQDFYDYLNDATQDVQSWIKEYTQPKQEECNGCCKSSKDLKKPSWMDANYFNLLKEIFG